MNRLNRLKISIGIGIMMLVGIGIGYSGTITQTNKMVFTSPVIVSNTLTVGNNLDVGGNISVRGTNLVLQVMSNNPVNGSFVAAQVADGETNYYWVNPVNDDWITNRPIVGWTGVLSGTNGIYFRFPLGTNGWLLQP